MTDEMRLKILGTPGEIDAVALQKGVSALLAVLRGAGIEDDFVLTDLRQASVELAVRPRRGADAESMAAFDRLLQEIRSLDSRVVPDTMSAASIDGVVGLSSLLDLFGVAGVQLGDDDTGVVRLGANARETARIAQSRSARSIGSVEGRVHRFVDSSSRREIGLTDRETNRSIRISFSLDQEAKVLGAVLRDIRAWGELRRDSHGRKESLRLDDFEFIRDGEEHVLGSMAGFLERDWTGGESSVETVRRQRD